METVNNAVNAASKAIWGDSTASNTTTATNETGGSSSVGPAVDARHSGTSSTEGQTHLRYSNEAAESLESQNKSSTGHSAGGAAPESDRAEREGGNHSSAAGASFGNDATRGAESGSSGGLLAGSNESSGPERLVSAGGALGGESKSHAGTGFQSSAGDARPDAQQRGFESSTESREPSEVKETPAEAGRDASSMAERNTAEGEGVDVRDEDPHEHSAVGSSAGGATIKSKQSDTVEKILQQADQIVKDKGMNKDPAKDEQIKRETSRAQEQEAAAKNEEGGAHREKVSLLDKVKAKIHKS